MSVMVLEVRLLGTEVIRVGDLDILLWELAKRLFIFFSRDEQTELNFSLILLMF